jgi:hypothetical protein
MSLGAEPGSAGDRSVDGVPGFQPPAIVVERLRKSYCSPPITSTRYSAWPTGSGC